jgi:hypothetical protein
MSQVQLVLVWACAMAARGVTNVVYVVHSASDYRTLRHFGLPVVLSFGSAS